MCIALNNPYKAKYKEPIVVGEDSKINIKILRDDGLLLVDNDNNILKVKGGDCMVWLKMLKIVAKDNNVHTPFMNRCRQDE